MNPRVTKFLNTFIETYGKNKASKVDSDWLTRDHSKNRLIEIYREV